MKRGLLVAAVLLLAMPLFFAREADTASITIDYPVSGSVFPPDMEPPTFLWHDEAEGVSSWLVLVTFEGDGEPAVSLEVPGEDPPRGEIDERCIAVTNEIYEPTPYQASARAWKPSADVWDKIKAGSVGRLAKVSFAGRREGSEGTVSYGSVELTTSPDPVGAPIFYRDVPLMPSATSEGVIKPVDQKAQPLIGWRLRDVGRRSSRLLLEQMPTCANCHSFSADGTTLAMDIDGPQGDKGAYGIIEIEPHTVIRDDDVISWNRFETASRPPGFNTLGFMARISPDGRYVVATVNEALYVRNYWDYRFSQTFFPTRGILAWYDRQTGKIQALPGADDPDFVHCSPEWTPDGKTLVFSRAAGRDPYRRDQPPATWAGDPNETQIQFDLYRIPFNGGKGGKPEPIPGASANGMSNSFPRISPDGKWLVWTKAKNGLLLRPDSRLWIVPLAGGEPRELESNLEPMNSWHSFSPNGRWLVFSSKANRPYTEMFLTHLDDKGHASPAILIENSTAANRAVNLPEFVNVAYDGFQAIAVPAVDHYAHFTRGNELARVGRYEEAIAEYRTALKGEDQEWRVTDWRIYDSLSKILMQQGQTELAIEHAQRSLESNPYNFEMRSNLGYLYAQTGRNELALEQLDIAVQLAPGDAQSWYNRAALRMRTGDTQGAVADFSEAIARNPRHLGAINARGMLLAAEGDQEGALADFDRVIELNPNNPTARYFRARILAAHGETQAAIRDLETALAVSPPNWEQRAEVEAELARLRGLEKK